MRLKALIAAALLISLPLTTGCAQVAQLGSSVATSISTAGPTQVKTLEQATLAATIATRGVEAYVRSGAADRATLLQFRELNNRVQTTLHVLAAANGAGQSLAMAAFNEALLAFNAYRASKGIPS